MDIHEKTHIVHDINRELIQSINGLTSTQEPDYIAALTTKFAARLSGILNRSIRGMTFKVGGCFIHQKPLAKFINPPYKSMKSPEIGDLLIVFKRIQNGEEQLNALLLQAKKNNNPWGKTKIQSTDHQLVLYTKWPLFKYQRAGRLNGKRRSIHPKSSTPGAQYLLIDESVSSHCCYCPICCSPVLFYTSPSSSIIQASHCFAWTLVDFLEFHTGKPFVQKHRGRIDDWSLLIWDLLEISVTSIFNRKNAGYSSTKRFSGNVMNFILTNNITDISTNDNNNIDNRDYNIRNDNEEVGLSLLVIEGIEDNKE